MLQEMRLDFVIRACTSEAVRSSSIFNVVFHVLLLGSRDAQKSRGIISRSSFFYPRVLCFPGVLYSLKQLFWRHILSTPFDGLVKWFMMPSLNLWFRPESVLNSLTKSKKLKLEFKISLTKIECQMSLDRSRMIQIANSLEDKYSKIFLWYFITRSTLNGNCIYA